MSDWLAEHKRLVDASAVVAAITIVTRTALLAVPEPLPWMAEVGEVFYDLSIAWFTAWSFQLLVIVAPAERERKRFNALMAPRIDRFIALGMELSDAIAVQAGMPIGSNFSVDGEAIGTVCKSVSLRDEMPGWMGDWGTVLRHLGARAETCRADMRPFYARLTPELLTAFEQEELAMDEILRMERFSRAFDAPDLSRLEDALFRWLTSIHMLYSLRSDAIAPDMETPQRSPLDSGKVHIPMDDLIRQHEELKKFLEEREN